MLLVRFLIWLTIEHPLIGIPVDIIVIAVVDLLVYPQDKAGHQDYARR